MVVIIDYGIGNLGSIANMLRKIGVENSISSNKSEIEKADKLILPGVGSFDTGMRNLSDLKLIEPLNIKVIGQKTPILGICLGMQLFTKKSQEGIMPGLGWIDAETVKFRFIEGANPLRIPHMGWNHIKPEKENVLLNGLTGESRYYFVHSYHVICNHDEDVLATTSYGYDFVSVVRKENIVGVQFHPEKSHKFGINFLTNFIKSF